MKTRAGHLRAAASHFLLYCGAAVSALFIPRRNWAWLEGWLFILLFAAFLIAALIPLAANTYLLEARVSSPFRSKQAPLDKAIFVLLSFLHLAWLLGIGIEDLLLGDRPGFGNAWVILGAALFILSVAGIHAVVAGNPFLIPAVERQEGQRIIAEGVYGWVRHPMYATVIAMSFGGSLLTSSLLGLVISFLILGAFWWRLVFEEKLLLKEFPDYARYRQKVKYRLIPLLL